MQGARTCRDFGHRLLARAHATPETCRVDGTRTASDDAADAPTRHVTDDLDQGDAALRLIAASLTSFEVCHVTECLHGARL
jgi:hypothetical protein